MMPISDSKRRLAFSVLNRNFGSPNNQQKGFASVDDAAHSAATLVAAQAKVSFSTANTLVREWYAQAGHVSEQRIAAGQRLDAFTQAYIEAALWSSTDNADDSGGEPLDKNYGPDDISPETMAKMIADCTDFQERYGDLIYQAEIDDGQAGHWFWLTRDGHGANFLDDDYKKSPEVSAALKGLYKAAKEYGEVNLDVDNGQIYGMGEARRRPVARQGRNAVRDYIAVDPRGRTVGGPFKDYGQAKRSADGAGGHVEFKMGEAHHGVSARRHPSDVYIFTLNGAWKHERVPAHVGMLVRINLGVEPDGHARSGAEDYVITRVDTKHGQEGRVAVKPAHGPGQETWGDPRGYLAVGTDSHGVAREGLDLVGEPADGAFGHQFLSEPLREPRRLLPVAAPKARPRARSTRRRAR